MYTHAAARPRAFGAASPFLLNPAILAQLSVQTDPRVAQCAQQKGTWDAASQTCAVGGIPTWAYVAGGLAVAGAAWFFLLK